MNYKYNLTQAERDYWDKIQGWLDKHLLVGNIKGSIYWIPEDDVGALFRSLYVGKEKNESQNRE